MENNQFLVSSRNLILNEALDPEVSWNMGGSIFTDLELGDQCLILTADYFYTTFENQMVTDLDATSSEVRIYNLDGRSFAHSFQFQATYEVNEFFEIRSAYKYYDVKTTINNQLQQVPFIPRNRFFLNASYASKYDKWKADVTVQWIGRKRLPNTSDKPEQFQREEFSPNYSLMNAQVTRGFKWGSIYLGAENILDFRQSDPIIDAENPFGDQFDASIVWGPIAGRVIYTGIRFKIER
jgi:outer membrane receptor protein involved in Fe transport